MCWFTSSLRIAKMPTSTSGELGVLEELVAPLDVVEREGDLLDRFEPDDLGDLLLFDRRQLDEAGEARLPAHADRARRRP